ncbi:MAG: PepSY-associated TM helix domain-containing protein [Pirellulales bacterium]|nr:PepSY-associated TM helix domain-containing protein [Pirellulales bacterium]
MTDQGKPRPRRRSLYAKSAAVFRWLHIYLSMLSFAAMMFFAFTGITLNHPTWFGASEQSVRDEAGGIDANLLSGEVDRLQVAESIRSTHSLRGRVAEFEIDEFECMLVFKGPGYAADVFVDRSTGKYTVTEISTGAMAVLNDLHKGRDSGKGWAWVIDISAVLMLLMSLAGFGLLFYLKKRRVSGVVTAVAGTVVLVAAWAIWVP